MINGAKGHLFTAQQTNSGPPLLRMKQIYYTQDESYVQSVGFVTALAQKC